MVTDSFFLLEFNIFSGRKLLRCGAARKTASEKIMGEVRGEKALLPYFFARRFLSYAPANANLFFITPVSIIFRLKSFSGRG